MFDRLPECDTPPPLRLERFIVAIISLPLIFTSFQGMEYYEAPFTIPGYSYVIFIPLLLSNCFLGFHVIIVTLFLIICDIHQYLSYLNKEYHLVL